MAVRPVHVLLISLLLYELTSGNYCRNEDNPSIQFCQSGIISGSRVYINGSSVKTKEELMDRGCVCYLEQIENKNVFVNFGGTCVYCGLQVRVRDVYFRSNDLGHQSYGWGSIVLLNDSKSTMTLSLDGSINNLSTAFCITIISSTGKKNSPVVLNLTCEGLVARSSTAISTSPNVITLPPTMVPDTTKEIVVGAAVGGSCAAVVLVIVINVIIFICYKRRLKNMYMQRQSTAPARVYTELKFGSRDGQNNSHVYSSVEQQPIYNYITIMSND
ncbi:hypothetical protein ACJMK2_024246 [Sinanodonta woodiana]|uniref:Uncharacterized protein n=1 Tax=Sinanodonta woodiana TaxID=1069815 RepID=A0ABD3T7N9_SINWO